MRFTTEPDLFALLEDLLRERRAELADLVGVCDALAELHGVALPLRASLTGPLRLEHLEAAAADEEQRARLVELLRRGTGVDLGEYDQAGKSSPLDLTEDLDNNEEGTWRAAAA